MCKLVQTSLIALHLHLLNLHGLFPFYCDHLCVFDSFDSLFRVRENILTVSVCVCMHVLSRFSCVRLFVNQCTVAFQAPLSMDFPGKNTGVGCHTFLQVIFPIQGWNLSLMSPPLTGEFFTTSATWEALALHIYLYI